MGRPEGPHLQGRQVSLTGHLTLFSAYSMIVVVGMDYKSSEELMICDPVA